MRTFWICLLIVIILFCIVFAPKQKDNLDINWTCPECPVQEARIEYIEKECTKRPQVAPLRCLSKKGYIVCLKTYTVQKNDSIGSILGKSGIVEWPTGTFFNRHLIPLVIEENNLTSERLEPGQTIDIPFVPVDGDLTMSYGSPES